MGRRATVISMPRDLREALNARLCDSGFSNYASLARWLNDELKRRGLHLRVTSRTVNRYGKKMERMGHDMARAREVAAVWADKFGREPNGDVGRLVIQIVQSLSFDVAKHLHAAACDGEVNIEDALTSLKDLALLVHRLERASELSEKREKELRAAVAQQAESEAQKQGISKDTAAAIRAAIEGAK